MLLSDKVAIVTGGARGIGAGIARGLAQAGASVAVVDLEVDAATATVQLLQEMGVHARFYRVDVSNAQAVRQMVRAVKDDYGRIDILATCAGIIGGPKQGPSVFDITDEEWQRVIDINLSGTWYCIQAAGRVMAEQGGGAIITISSIGATHPSGGSGAAYHASKGGVIGLSNTLAVALAPYNIRVNCIAPGYIETPMTRPPGAPSRIGEPNPRVPLNRVGVPDDFGGTAVFLASDASAYITGQLIYVDGGTHVLGSRQAPKHPLPGESKVES